MAWLEHLTDSVFRRLQLAAETGGGIGFLFRPGRFRSQRSWADVRLLVQPVVRVADVPVRGRSPEAAVGSSDPCAGTGETEQRWMRRVRVELLHCRGRVEGGHVELEIDDETSDVRLAAGVATAKDLHRKTGA